MIKPFKVEISEETLQNIYSNVKNYQWHEMPDDGGWDSVSYTHLTLPTKA